MENVGNGFLQDGDRLTPVGSKCERVSLQRCVDNEMNRVVVTLIGIELVNERGGVCNTAISRGRITLRTGRESSGVPAHQGLVAVGAQMQREHLPIKVFANGHLVAPLSVWNGKAVGNLNLAP